LEQYYDRFETTCVLGKDIGVKESYMFLKGTSVFGLEKKMSSPDLEVKVRNYKQESKRTQNGSMIDDFKDIEVDNENFLDKHNIMRLQSTNRTFLEQVLKLAIREIRETLRSPWSFIAQLILTLAASIFIGVLYYDQDFGIAGSQNRMGFIFWICSYLSLIAMNSIWLFSEGNMKIQHCREVFVGYYSLDAWFFQRLISKFFSNSILQPFILTITTYWMIGLHAGRFPIFLFIVVCISILSDLQGIIIGIISQDKKKLGIVMFTIVFLFNGLTCGLLLNMESVPPLLRWFGYFGFWRVSYEALMITEFEGTTVKIDPKGMPPYNAPGEFWLNELGMNVENYDFDLSMLVILISINVMIAYFLFKLLMKIKK